MLVTTVTVYVHPENINDFIQASIENHKWSIQESGNLRFDVLQCTQDPSRFLLYEAYSSEAAAAAHKQTEHYQRWRDKVGPWMIRPREGVTHRVIAPEGNW